MAGDKLWVAGVELATRASPGQASDRGASTFGCRPRPADALISTGPPGPYLSVPIVIQLVSPTGLNPCRRNNRYRSFSGLSH